MPRRNRRTFTPEPHVYTDKEREQALGRFKSKRTQRPAAPITLDDNDPQR